MGEWFAGSPRAASHSSGRPFLCPRRSPLPSSGGQPSGWKGRGTSQQKRGPTLPGSAAEGQGAVVDWPQSADIRVANFLEQVRTFGLTTAPAGPYKPPSQSKTTFFSVPSCLHDNPLSICSTPAVLLLKRQPCRSSPGSRHTGRAREISGGLQVP